MKLNFLVPIFDFNYIGENKSSDAMWENTDYHEKLKDYLIDSERNIVLKRIDNLFDYASLGIELYSQIDITKLTMAIWAFHFNCEMEDLDTYKQKLNLLLLAFRISIHSDLSIKFIICENIPHLSDKYSDDWKYAIAEKRLKKETKDINSLDLDNIIIVYQQLQAFFKVSPIESVLGS